MTFTSVAQTNSKTAEFARLFDLFDRVATRRTRALTEDTSEVISADDIANVPAEFAPVLKNISMVISLRALRDKEGAQRTQVTSTTGTCRDTLTVAPLMTPRAKHPVSCLNVMREDLGSPSFPLGRRYPFTFKLMLHKLYDLDEWAEKVKDALEASKSQFKPLTERVQNAVRDATADITEEGEKKSSIRPVCGVPARVQPPSAMKHSHLTAMPSKPETSRVLKKRCTGRRKSVSGPMSARVWVYDAVIAATEVAGSRPAVDITLSVPRDAGSVVKNRTRHQSLTTLEEAHGDTARRQVKITVPLSKEEVSECVLPQPLSVPISEPVQEVIKTERTVKKRTSVAIALASEPWKMVAVKRPLCV